MITVEVYTSRHFLFVMLQSDVSRARHLAYDYNGADTLLSVVQDVLGASRTMSAGGNKPKVPVSRIGDRCSLEFCCVIRVRFVAPGVLCRYTVLTVYLFAYEEEEVCDL